MSVEADVRLNKVPRKPGYPAINYNIKLPNSSNLPMSSETCMPIEDETEQQQRRQRLINFGHSQWGFNNWSWSVTKQDLDFVDFSNGKYSAGVVAFVCVKVKTIDIHRENIGYATSLAPMKGSAIYQARKCAVTNALRETLLSFGGNVATELLELLDTHKIENTPTIAPEAIPEHNQNSENIPLPVVSSEPRNASANNVNRNVRRDSSDSSGSRAPVAPRPAPPPANQRPLAPAPRAPLGPPAPAHRPASNVSYVLQPVMGAAPPYSPRVAPVAPPHVFPNAYYEYAPWPFAYEGYDRHHANVSLNFNLPPRNLALSARAPERPGAPHDDLYLPPPHNQGCWIKPGIFYDGFWTEQKVKKWVAEQVEKQFPDDQKEHVHN